MYMYMYVYVYVYMYVCMYVYMYMYVPASPPWGLNSRTGAPGAPCLMPLEP